MERYESLGPVGEGSYGTVLKCRHRDSGRLVAIKKFMDSDDDKTVKKIALREIKLLRQLRHDNLVNLLEVWKRRRRWYLVFEFVDRTLLDDLEQSPGGLDLNTSRQYLYQILRAAAFCHQQNIIHRDIKPENILISQGGVVKLCDFGFARTMASPSEGAVYTDYVATRWYRAPELLVGDIKYSKPVDVWAVGCLLIEMLTGQPLFPGDSDLDQIYHIVRCFGNLTSHHQELFYRNPVFSGVRLPECSGRVSLQQRFPTITPTALDLAQSCLEMDPERRVQCSELLEHPLFTQDSFHIRFLDELNAKIQKDHRENSTLPKITKTENNPKQERDDEKNRRGKDKKHPEDADEKVGKGKLEKTKGKQHLKASKTIRNKSEPLMSTKPTKTLGNKVIHNAAQPSTPMKSKPGKAAGVELTKEPALSKSTKTLYLYSSEAPKTAASPNDGNTEEAITKHERVVSLEPRAEYLDNTKDIEYNGSEICRRSKSEQSQECGNNTNTILSSSPEATLKSAVDRTDRQPSNDHAEVITPTFISKSCKSSNTSERQTNRPAAESQQRTDECPKVLPSDPKLSKTASTSHPKTNKSNLSLSTTPSQNISARSSTVCIEVSPAHSTMTVAEEISNPKLSKVDSPSKGLPEDLPSQASGGHNKMNLESSVPRCLHQESPSKSKITTEDRTTSMQNKEASVVNTNLKTLKVLDKENRQDLALLVPISAAAVPLVIQTMKASGMSSRNEIRNNSSDFESEVKSVKAVHPKSLAGELKSKPGYYHTRSTSTPRTQKTTFPRDTRNKSDNPEKNVTTKISTSTPDDKASSRSSVSEFDCRVPSSSPPPPPPPPSSTPLLIPPSSASLIHPFSGVGTNSPTATDHLTLGAGVHPGTNSLRHVDKLRHHGGLHSQQARQFLSSHISGPLTFQAPEKSPIRERSFLSDHCNLGNGGSVATDKNKSHILLPDLRSTALPELRGREGKHNKVSTKDQRKDKHPVSTSRPSEPQQHRHNSTDAYTPKQT